MTSPLVAACRHAAVHPARRDERLQIRRIVELLERNTARLLAEPMRRSN